MTYIECLLDIEKDMLVRTKDGTIDRIKSYYCRNEELNIWRITLYNEFYFEEELSEFSTSAFKYFPTFNILDLIDDGDEVKIKYLDNFNNLVINKAFVSIYNDFIEFKTAREMLKYYKKTNEWFFFTPELDFYNKKPKEMPIIESIITKEKIEKSMYKL